MLAEVHPNATTSSGMPGRIRSTAGAMRGPDRAQGFRRDVGVVEDARFVEGNAGEARGSARNSCSMVWSVASTTSPIAARAIRPPSRSEGRMPRSSGGGARVARHGGSPWVSGGHEAVHGDGRRAPGDLVGDDLGRTVRHGPADMSVAGIEIKISKTPAAEERQVSGCHRPQPRPHLRAVVVATFGISSLRHADVVKEKSSGL